MSLKILLADDSDISRNMIKSILAERQDWQVTAEAIDGAEAVEKAKQNCPDIAILDISMPKMNGIEAAREILGLCPSAIVLTDSLHDVHAISGELQRAGVRAFVSKGRLVTDLIPTIEAVLKGQDLLRKAV